MSSGYALSTGITLASLIHDIGYGATRSVVTLRKTLDCAGVTAQNAAATLKEEEIARVLSLMARTHTGLEQSPVSGLSAAIFKGVDPVELQKMQTWDVELFVAVVYEMNPTLDWFSVCRALDHPEFIIFDAMGLGVLLNASKAALKDIYQFPISTFFSRWKNEKGQLSFLKHAIQSAPEVFSLNQGGSARRVIPLDGSNGAARAVIPALGNQAWNSLDLLESLVLLSDGPLYDEAKTLFELGAQQSPELILLGLAQLPITWTGIFKEISPGLVMLFLAGHQNSNFVLPKLWQFSHGLAMSGLQH
ncbi:hypothetical protein BDK51DRAFT_32336, partial [Blyttiomyces helicus]